MKKRFLLSAILVMLLLSAFHLFAADVELVGNPGFENGTSPWERRNCTFNQSSAYAHSGTYSGQATGRSET